MTISWTEEAKRAKDPATNYRINNGLNIPVDKMLCEMCQIVVTSGATQCPNEECPGEARFRYFTDEDREGKAQPAPTAELCQRRNSYNHAHTFCELTNRDSCWNH